MSTWDWITSAVAATSWSEVLWFVAIFLATFALSIAEVTFILVKLPANYFLSRKARRVWADKPWFWRWLAVVAKNALGALHVLLGLALSVPGVPGQGALTILIGVMMLDIPGVHWLERKLVRQPKVRSAIDRIRARFGKPPLILDGE
jgi:hypothetical protein